MVLQDLHANIGTMKPATDLCFECQQFMTQIVWSTHLSEDENSAWLQQAKAHLEIARTEWSFYIEQIWEWKGGTTEDTTPLQMHYIALTMHNKCTFQTTHNNLGQHNS